MGFWRSIVVGCGGKVYVMYYYENSIYWYWCIYICVSVLIFVVVVVLVVCLEQRREAIYVVCSVC